MPSASFPDNSSSAYPDCRLLHATSGPRRVGPDRGRAPVDHRPGDPDRCAALAVGADVVDATAGCNEGVVPRGGDLRPGHQPDRGPLHDLRQPHQRVRRLTRRPGSPDARSTTSASSTGSRRFAPADIGLDQFLDLNEGVGGFDRNGLHQAGRSVADPERARRPLYRTGRINSGSGGIPDVPIVDIRNYVDDEVNVHQYANTYMFRARLLRTNGTFANQVMFRARGGANTKADGGHRAGDALRLARPDRRRHLGSPAVARR